MNSFPLLVGLACAVGAGLLAHSFLQILLDFGRRFSHSFGRSRGRLAALGLTGQQRSTTQLTEDELLGLAAIPWANLYALSALISLLLFALVGPYLAGVFSLTLLSLPGLVWLFKRYLVQQRRRFLVGQVRQLLIDIRLHMSLSGSLLLGLENIARTTHERNVVYRALQRRLSGGSAKSGLEVLQQLAGDLKSLHLFRVAQRVQSAQQSGGALGIDQAIASATDELNEEIASQSDEQMQRLPLRITLLAMPFLLGPIVILLFYPLVDHILKTLAGTSVGGGF
jgi:hypothetical protein